VTTPAQDAPLVLPAVAFRPVRLLVVCAAITALAILAATWLSHPMFGLFFGVGLTTGLGNALLVRRAARRITAAAHPLKKQMAVNSSLRLMAVTVITLGVAFVFRPEGLGMVFGVALFQVLLVFTTAVPVWRAMRDPGAASGAPADGGQR
jgi:hypothetical protein